MSRWDGISGGVCKDVFQWVSMQSCGFCEVDPPPQCGWASSNPSRAWIEPQVSKEEFAPCFLPHCWAETPHLSSLALALAFTPSASMVLRTSDLDWNFTTSFPMSLTCREMGDYGTSQPPWLQEPIPHIELSIIYAHIFILISNSIGCSVLWRTLTNNNYLTYLLPL